MIRTLAICGALTAGVASAQNTPDWSVQFNQDVAKCWNVNTSAEQWPAMIVSFEMTPEATPVVDSFFLIGATEASDATVQAAFASIRRAVIRCADFGYDLPENDYDAWSTMIITIDPRVPDQQ